MGAFPEGIPLSGLVRVEKNVGLATNPFVNIGAHDTILPLPYIRKMRRNIN
jgi:hypothetical protein